MSLRRPRLRTRLGLALVATSLATLATTWLVVLPTVESRLVSDQRVELRNVARAVRPELHAVPPSDRRQGSPALTRLVRRLQRRTGERIAIYDRMGEDLADTGAAWPRDARTLTAEALRRRDGVVTGDRGGVAFAATVAGRPDTLTLVITRPLDGTRAAISVLRAALPVGLAAGLAVALALAVLVSRSLARGLSRLRADADALGAEGLSHRVSVTGADEIAVVAQALETMRERLVAEQRTRQDFLATASHELRTPLASLQAGLELLREQIERGGADPEAISRNTDTALRQTRRLTALASDLLDLSRLDGGAALAPEALELRELAAMVAAEFSARFDAAGRSLVVAGEHAIALADPAAAARIVRILLDNAGNYGAGDVVVAVAPAGDRIWLTVTDHGPGIAERERERVFQRFTRGAAAGASAGSGLGLPIARGLARAMGGEIVAEPAAAGARLVLTLPRA